MTILSRIFLVVGLLSGISGYAAENNPLSKPKYTKDEIAKAYVAIVTEIAQRATDKVAITDFLQKKVDIIKEGDLLHMAVVEGYYEVVQALLQVKEIKQLINVLDKNNDRSPLMYAYVPDDKTSELVEKFHEVHGLSGEYIYTSFLPVKDNKKRIELIKLLLTHGASPIQENNRGGTPLHIFAYAGTPVQMELLLEKAQETAGATFSIDIAARRGGSTLLHMAAAGENREMIEFLVRRGADVNKQMMDGNTPLHTLMRYQKNTVEDTIDFLIKQGANPLIRNKNGKMAYDLIQDQNSSLKAYLKSKMEEFCQKEGALTQGDAQLQGLLSHDPTNEKSAEITANLTSLANGSWWQSPKVLVPTAIMLVATGGIAYKWYRLKQKRSDKVKKDLTSQVAVASA